MPRLKYVANLDRLGMGESERFGGKNASLGEMIGRLSKAGIRVPGGFASSADAYREFIGQGGLKARIEARLNGLDADDVEALARCGADIRGWIEATSFPKQIEAEISQAYRELTGGDDGVSVAVRSSATAEDLPDASFAGQQETFLNIRGLPSVMAALKRVFASLYNDRAISYRVHKGFEHSAVALSAGVSVKTVEVPEAHRDRFCLSDDDVVELARFALLIEEHYQRPMDIEWAQDGADGKIYILQARPETVKSRKSGDSQERYRLKRKSEILASGRAIGHKIGAGTVRVVKDASEMGRVKPGDIIVTDMTDPNWEPVMKRAAAIVTNRGGRTCHAA